MYAPHSISNNDLPVGTPLFQTAAATKCIQPEEVVYKMVTVVSRGEKKGGGRIKRIKTNPSHTDTAAFLSELFQKDSLSSHVQAENLCCSTFLIFPS